MTGTNCDLFTHKSSRSYLNHLVRGHLAPCVYKTTFLRLRHKTRIGRSQDRRGGGGAADFYVKVD
jgi:hypothetical protein